MRKKRQSSKKGANQQPDLFAWARQNQRRVANEAKQEGMQRVEDHADAAWKDEIFACVVQVAGYRHYFTADHVFRQFDRNHMTTSTHDLRAFGPVMLKAAKAGVCQKAQILPINSLRKSKHAGPMCVWESLIWQPHDTKEGAVRMIKESLNPI